MKKKKTIGKNKDISIRAKHAQKLILENNGNVSKSLREAGYSDAYAKNPQQFRLTKAGQELIAWIDKECMQIRTAMKRTRNQAKYKELADTLIGLQKLSTSTLTGKNEDDKDLMITIKHFKE